MAIYSTDTVLELVDLIYSAASDSARWNTLLERLSQVTSGEAATIHHAHLGSLESSFSALWNLDLSYVPPYLSYYCHRNLWFTTRPAIIQQGSVNAGEDLCPDDIMLRSEFHNDFLIPMGVSRCVAATVLMDGHNSTNLTIFKPRCGATPFSEEECALLRQLMPHFQRALQLHNRIRGLEHKGAAAADALEHIPIALIMLGTEGRVLQMNEAAAAILAGQSALRVTSRGLVAAIPSENQRLRRLIRGAISTGGGRGLNAGGSILISRELKRGLHVLVAPLRTRGVQIGNDVPVAVVFVSDPERQATSEVQVFAQLFGLTPAEARLARVLAAGESLKDATERLDVAESTVKSQLKSIFAKTGTSRQAELVRLVLLAPTQTTHRRKLDRDVRR
jgi:DNA-binding CsgD family transcriptional regulator/PAS domain-containing protein